MRRERRSCKVLEIGSGSTPDPRADVLVDRHIRDNRERNRAEPIWRDSRPLIAADGAALPFGDKSFDLVLAIGVLEHAEAPTRFLDEMARVGKRGIVQVPTTFAERILFRPFHKYTFSLDGNTLVIRPKNFPNVFGGLFDYLTHFDPDFTQFMGKNRWLFNLVYEWEGCPSYRVETYDPTRPAFAPFNRTYQDRAFEFQICVSEIPEPQVERLLAKNPPVTWTQRVKRWIRATRRVISKAVN